MAKAMAVLLVILTLSGTACLAGTMWHYHCGNPDCRFEGDLAVGGGFVFERVSGYCTTCKGFVSLSWKRKGLDGELRETAAKADLPTDPPASLGKVWNPLTGLVVDLHPCPTCGRAFLPISEIDFGRVTRMATAAFSALLRQPDGGDALPEGEMERREDALEEAVRSRQVICPRCQRLTLGVGQKAQYD